MNELYHTIESTVIWGVVVIAVGLVIYLAYLQYLRARHRRLRHRHRARRTMSRQSASLQQGHPGHGRQGPLQQTTGL